MKAIFSPGHKTCSMMEQYDKFENFSAEIAIGDKNSIERSTGCLYPCSYLEYKEVEMQHIAHGNMHGVGFYYGSVAVNVKKEVSEYFLPVYICV